MIRLSVLALAVGLLFEASSAATTAVAVKSEPASVPLASTNSPVAQGAFTNAVVPAAPAVTKDASRKDDDDDDDGHHVVFQVGTANHHDSALLEDAIPFVAIISTFATPILIVFCIAYFRFRRRQETLSTVREYVSKGLPVPPEILAGGGDFRRGETVESALSGGAGRCDVRRGLKLVFIGAAISLALFISSPHHRDWAWGLIPLVIGLGYLAVGYFEMNQDKKDARPPGSPL